jgi:hypothetical protein
MEKMSRSAARRVNYSLWSVEELRRLALQLRVRDAGTKSRRELMQIFGAS